MVPQHELVVFARVSDPAVDLETTPADGPWLEATAAAIPWSLGVDIAIWNAVGTSFVFFILSVTACTLYKSLIATSNI